MAFRSQPFNRFFGEFALAQKANKLEFWFPNYARISDLLAVFQKEGFILSYTLCSKTNVWRVCLRSVYTGSSLVMAWRKFNQSHLTVTKLWHLNQKHPTSLAILSTNKGIMTQDDALKKNIGGQLIVVIYT